MRSFLRGALAVATLTGAQLGAQSRLVHPNGVNLEAPAGAAVVSRADTSTTNALLDRWADRLRRATVTASAGSLDGDDDYEFGTLRDIAVAGDRLVVLDESHPRLLVLGPDLALRRAIGREGSGPAEFRQPIALAFESDSVLRVFDSVLGLKRFRLGVGARRDSVLSAVPPRVAVQSICLGARQMIAVAPSSMQNPGFAAADVEPLLAVIEPDGSVSSSFSDSYRSPSALVRRAMSEASLGCGHGGLLVVALAQLPLARVYSSSGALLRTVRFTDFTQMYSIEQPNARGQLSIGLDPETRRGSSVTRIVPVSAQIFAIQIETRALTRNRRAFLPVALDTYLLDAVTGEAVFVAAELPLLGHVESHFAVGFSNEPYPRVLRLALGARADEPNPPR